jgi:hypothetical protein
MGYGYYLKDWSLFIPQSYYNAGRNHRKEINRILNQNNKVPQNSC